MKVNIRKIDSMLVIFLRKFTLFCRQKKTVLTPFKFRAFPKNSKRMVTIHKAHRMMAARGQANPGRSPLPGTENPHAARLGSDSRSRSSIAARKARGETSGAVWIRQRISPTSTWDVRCNEFYRPPVPSTNSIRISREGVRKFDGEVEEKEADKVTEGRGGRMEDRRKGREKAK